MSESNDNETRMTRLEGKVDKISEKVDETREDIYAIKSDLKVHSQQVQQHVDSDAKIVKHFQPLLEDLAYKKKRKEDNKRRLKEWSMRFGIAGAMASVVFTIIRVFKG